MRKINVYDEIMTENMKRKYGNQSNFYTNFQVKDGLGIEL